MVFMPDLFQNCKRIVVHPGAVLTEPLLGAKHARAGWALDWGSWLASFPSRHIWKESDYIMLYKHISCDVMLYKSASFHVPGALPHARYITDTCSTSEPLRGMYLSVPRISCDAGWYFFDYKGLRADHMVWTAHFNSLNALSYDATWQFLMQFHAIMVVEHTCNAGFDEWAYH